MIDVRRSVTWSTDRRAADGCGQDDHGARRRAYRQLVDVGHVVQPRVADLMHDHTRHPV